MLGIKNKKIILRYTILQVGTLILVWALCRMFKADVRGLKTKMTEWTPSFIHKCIISNSCFFTLSFLMDMDTWMHDVLSMPICLQFSFTPSPLLLLLLSLSFIRYCGKNNRTLESCSRLTQKSQSYFMVHWFYSQESNVCYFLLDLFKANGFWEM